MGSFSIYCKTSIFKISISYGGVYDGYPGGAISDPVVGQAREVRIDSEIVPPEYPSYTPHCKQYAAKQVFFKFRPRIPRVLRLWFRQILLHVQMHTLQNPRNFDAVSF